MEMINKIKRLKHPNAPWQKFYSKEQKNASIPDKSMYELLEISAFKYPNVCAIEYYGVKITYRNLIKQINRASMAFKSHGIRKGDIVTICMPNVPEAIISVYALNKIGAISEMIHPLSSENEIKNYLNSTGSVMLIMIDMCYSKVKDIIKETNVYKTIVVSANDSMSPLMSISYQITKGSHIKKPNHKSEYITWKEFINSSKNYKKEINVLVESTNPAIILHSGGTTGEPKSIVIVNKSFNTLSVQAKLMLDKINPGDKVLGILPIFHGFGLGVSIHASLCMGMEVVLIPKFDAKKMDKLVMKYKPSYITGVPTLYEALLNTKNKHLDLSCVKYALSGGDSMSINLSRKLNAFFLKCGSNIKIAQGYGMTEATAATCISFLKGANKEGSIGIPLPLDYMKIVMPNTIVESLPNVDGEICITGPTIMLGYLDNEKETNEVLRLHNDGRIWLHTGDMGYMDTDGVFFYRQRIKRMLISSGFNVYPSQIEEVIEMHEAVLNCTVIGIPHPYKVQVAKAFIVLKNGYFDTIFTRNSIKDHCKKYLSTYSLPYEYEFRKSLPKTIIGKIDFKKLQMEAEEKNEK